MKAFRTYNEAFNYACDSATTIGITHGIGKDIFGMWTVQMIPKNPYGSEARLEKVLPGTPPISNEHNSNQKGI